MEVHMPSKAKAILTGRALTLSMSALAISAISASSLAQTVPPKGTTSIQRESEKARDLKEPSYQTREERLSAQPLDWNTTIGTPTPLPALTAKERSAQKKAKQGSTAAKKPDPKSEAEARKLHPDDWK
jgi:hypothetical protein